MTAYESSQCRLSEAPALFLHEREGEKVTVLGFGMEINEEAVEAREHAGAKDVREWADAWFERVQEWSVTVGWWRPRVSILPLTSRSLLVSLMFGWASKGIHVRHFWPRVDLPILS